MSFELNKEGSRVLYLNFRSIGDGTQECEAEQLFSFSHLIEDSSKYLVAINRFRIPIQSVPMQPAIQNAFILRNKTGGNDIFISTAITFSLYDWLIQIDRSNANLNVILTADGRFQILNFDFDAFSIELNPNVAAILDMTVVLDGVGVQSVFGATPLFDRFDQLFKINVEALNGLGNLQQEIIDTNIFVTLLTDFIIPSEFSTSVQNTIDAPLTGQVSYTFPVRQDLEFNAAANQRLINFRGSSPIQNVKVRVVAIFRDGTRHPIVLTRNSVFELKLAFFRRS
jgi:hypothetical protein